ncbi:hypothetical protein ILYODFUR_033394 [Ilyodon furcidens]|uniref:Uncharacterized protein n=1 Tax=Ilyodon furcidens TaxID=33524 RepID=A0ABV0UMH1_9TELE
MGLLQGRGEVMSSKCRASTNTLKVHFVFNLKKEKNDALLQSTETQGGNPSPWGTLCGFSPLRSGYESDHLISDRFPAFQALPGMTSMEEKYTHLRASFTLEIASEHSIGTLRLEVATQRSFQWVFINSGDVRAAF